MKYFLRVVILCLCLCSFACLWTSCWWITRANTVVGEEADPRTQLTRYEWFKDMSATLDSRLSDIKVYESRIANMSNDYKDIPRIKWSREDREQYNVWQSEVSGVKASFNDLAAKYNAAMAKINYAYCNIGELPKGATTPLPRTYKEYLEK